MCEEHTDRVSLAVIPDPARDFRILTVLAYVVVAVLHFSADRIAANFQRDCPEDGEVNHGNEKDRGANRPKVPFHAAHSNAREKARDDGRADCRVLLQLKLARRKSRAAGCC